MHRSRVYAGEQTVTWAALSVGSNKTLRLRSRQFDCTRRMPLSAPLDAGSIPATSTKGGLPVNSCLGSRLLSP